MIDAASNEGQKPTGENKSTTCGTSPEEALLPARMLNELTYCPRLFFYEHVQGVFVDNRETVEGSLQHKRVDEKEDELPKPEELAESEKPVRARSVMLSSDTHGVIAKMDLVESTDGTVIPVDYKRGRPYKEEDGSLTAWDTDQVQLCVQALVLRDNGYQCDEGIIYYRTTRQRVRLAIDGPVIERTLETLQRARDLCALGEIPPPLLDSPKCPRCSLVGICLPDETNLIAENDRIRRSQVQRTLFDIDRPRQATIRTTLPSLRDIRRLVPARDDLRPLYLNTQGLSVGKSGLVLKIKEKGKVIQEVRIKEICQLNLMGSIQLTTQAIQTLCQAEVPIAYFSLGGWFYGVTQALGVKNIFLRREQFRLADVPAFCLRLARALVAGKIRNQRTMLQRNHIEPPRQALNLLQCMQRDAEQARSVEQLLGIEGTAARQYFQSFSGMLKTDRDDDPTESDEACQPLFHFTHRNRRPPRDPVNALLSLAYSLLAKDLMIVTQTVGFDPYMGFYHQPRFGRASLALDLMEPFRPLIADSVVLSAINTRMVTPGDFVHANDSVALKPEGRKKFYRAYEQRMDTLVTHPLLGYRISYRRLLEIQARLLGRVLTGELSTYPVFTTR